jgi:hypothetical protein
VVTNVHTAQDAIFHSAGQAIHDIEGPSRETGKLRSAQSAIFQSAAQAIHDIQGPSREMGKFPSPGSTDKGLNALHSQSGPLMLLAGKPALAGLEVGRDNEVRLPASVLFHHSNPKEKLTYSCAMANGEPLPSWLVFDAASLTFSGKPPEGESGTMELVVTAKDGSGHEAGVKVTLRLHDADSKNAEETENTTAAGLQEAGGAEGAEKLAAAGQQESGANEKSHSADKEHESPSLRSQISDYGQSGILKAAQRLLRNL